MWNNLNYLGIVLWCGCKCIKYRDPQLMPWRSVFLKMIDIILCAALIEESFSILVRCSFFLFYNSSNVLPEVMATLYNEYNNLHMIDFSICELSLMTIRWEVNSYNLGFELDFLAFNLIKNYFLGEAITSSISFLNFSKLYYIWLLLKQTLHLCS